MTEQQLRRGLEKAPSGIGGLDEITGGGLPRRRTTLVCGGAGCGKTLFGVQFLVHGALEFGEPGVLMAFEETAQDLADNVASLGWDLDDLVARNLLSIDFVSASPTEIVEAGDWDLDGLMIRLAGAIAAVGAKRVVIDSIELLFTALEDERLLRSELRRMFRWLGEQGVTAIVTGERGEGSLTRHGLEEYLSDCVIFLDHRLTEQISTRRLRIVKYRGSAHGADEHPFLIGHEGFTVIPVTSMGLDHEVSHERTPSGIPELDEMLSGGAYRGSTILLNGTAGSGKTTLGVTALMAECARGERALLFAFEEAPDQIARNMSSVGLDLQSRVADGTLRIIAARPAVFGLESHLAKIHREIEEFAPSSVLLDPVTSLDGDAYAIKAMLSRLVDFLKSRRITAYLTALDSRSGDEPALGISSVVDTWIELSDPQGEGERNRRLSVRKSRGMAHSNQLREFLITEQGVTILPPYGGGGAMLMGSERLAAEMSEQGEAVRRHRAVEVKRRRWEQRRAELEAQMARLRLELETERDEAEREMNELEQTELHRTQARDALVAGRLGVGSGEDPEADG